MIDPLRKFLGALLALGVAVDEIVGAVAGEEGELHEFFHHVDDPVVVWRGLHPVVLVKFGERLGDRGLVRNCNQTHPAAQLAQLVDGIEGLGPAADLHHGERLALGRADGPDRQRDPVDLGLHDAGHRAVSFGRAPDHALRPGHEFTKLLHLGMVRRRVVRQWQAGRVEDPRLCAKPVQNAGSLLRGQPAERARPDRTVEQQDAWPVRGPWSHQRGFEVGHRKKIVMQVRKVMGHRRVFSIVGTNNR